MGLDQHLNAEIDGAKIEIAYWRKHPDLNGLLEQIAKEKDPELKIFNCQNVELNEEDCRRIMLAVINEELPFTEGFFFGKSLHDKEERETTYLAFATALGLVQMGNRVTYYCWW